MSKKRFEFYSDDYLVGIIDTVTGKKLNHFATIDLLNSQDEEIKELETKRKLLVQKKNRYFRLYNSVEAEVKARVDTLNKVCEYYLTEAQFKADTDPNQAVREVINEILNTEVEMW